MKNDLGLDTLDSPPPKIQASVISLESPPSPTYHQIPPHSFIQQILGDHLLPVLLGAEEESKNHKMDLEILILSEVSQTEKDKYHMISLICGI